MTERIFAIGDIHGHKRELKALIERLDKEADFDLATDDLVILGDLVDAGPDSKGVIEYLMEMQSLLPETVHILKGNHDHMMVDTLKYHETAYDKNWWIKYSGYADKTLASYGGTIDDPKVPQEHIDWLDNLPHYWETEKYFFSHAGVPPRLFKNMDLTDKKVLWDMLWIREAFYTSKQQWEKKIIFAHTPFPVATAPGVSSFEPLVRDNMIGINTMPRDEGKLTCVQLPEEVFYFQPKL